MDFVILDGATAQYNLLFGLLCTAAVWLQAHPEARMTDRSRQPLFVAALAAALFVPLFIFRRLGAFDFWWWMSADIAVLLVVTAVIDRGSSRPSRPTSSIVRPSKIGMGLLAAAALYGVFFGGNVLVREILPFAGTGHSRVYGFKAGVSPLRVIFLLPRHRPGRGAVLARISPAPLPGPLWRVRRMVLLAPPPFTRWSMSEAATRCSSSRRRSAACSGDISTCGRSRSCSF